MTHCSLRNCRNGCIKGITVHRFPANVIRRQIWINSCWNLLKSRTENSTLCDESIRILFYSLFWLLHNGMVNYWIGGTGVWNRPNQRNRRSGWMKYEQYLNATNGIFLLLCLQTRSRYSIRYSDYAWKMKSINIASFRFVKIMLSFIKIIFCLVLIV